ncbi:hypothetical protein OKW42_003162 [Paraburkholderia sp. WC7.3d]
MMRNLQIKPLAASASLLAAITLSSAIATCGSAFAQGAP